jgi:hypothetical protein
MKNDPVHPARSADFLSRLHDGELAPAERAHFESHRAHCADCRGAASQFEAALSLFRASSTSPPPADLSARILRKLQTGTARRPAFGVVFGINLKWAAAFSTAIIAVIMGSAVMLQRDSARRMAPRETPIPVLLKGRAQLPQTPAPSAEGRLDRPRQKTGDAGARKEPAPAPASASATIDEGLASSNSPRHAAARPDQKLKAQPSEYRAAEAQADEPAARSSRVMGAEPSQLRRNPEGSGGDGAATSSVASLEPGAPARLVIVALDGQGNAPEIVSAGAAELLSDLRGRQYFLLVEASGRVREARTNGKESLQKRARVRDALENAAAAPLSVWSLRFRASDRARRLLLRVN